MIIIIFIFFVTAIGKANSAAVCAQQSLVLVSTGRTGSTLLMRTLSHFPTTFAIPEPFKVWTLSSIVDGVLVPKYTDLLSCSFLQNTTVAKKVFWSYACINNNVIASRQSMLQRCKDGKMNNKDFQLLFDFCTKSCVRVLKTIRHHVYSLNKNQVEDIERTSLFQAIHLVRRPWDSVVSKYSHGWPYESTIESMSSALWTECRHVIRNEDKLRPLFGKNILIIRNEDIVKNLRLSFRTIMLWLKWNRHLIDADLDDISQEILSKTYGPSLRQNTANLTLDERDIYVSSVETKNICKLAYERHQYHQPAF